MNLQAMVDGQLAALQTVDEGFELVDFSVGDDYASITYRLGRQDVAVADSVHNILPNAGIYTGYDQDEMFVHVSHYGSDYF